MNSAETKTDTVSEVFKRALIGDDRSELSTAQNDQLDEWLCEWVASYPDCNIDFEVVAASGAAVCAITGEQAECLELRLDCSNK